MSLSEVLHELDHENLDPLLQEFAVGKRQVSVPRSRDVLWIRALGLRVSSRASLAAAVPESAPAFD